MALKTIILSPAGLTVPDLSSSAYATFPMMNGETSRCIVPLPSGVPADFYAMSAVYLIIRSASTGNLYLRPGATRIDATTEGAVESSTGSYAAFAGGPGTGVTEFISLPSTMWSSLTDINAGDALNLVVDRDGSNVLDTYEADLDIIGIKFVYEVGATVTGDHYCTQEDMEWRIGTATLAQLTNDTMGAATPDVNVIETILDRVDALIDARCGTVYTVPFSPVPDIIKQIAISLAVFDAFQRKPSNVGMPKMWEAEHKEAVKMLDEISIMQRSISGTVAYPQSAIVEATDDPIVDFNDTDNMMSDF